MSVKLKSVLLREGPREGGRGGPGAGLAGELTHGDISQLLRPEVHVLENRGQHGRQKLVRGGVLQSEAAVSPAPAPPPGDSAGTIAQRARSHWPPSATLTRRKGLTLKPPRPERPMGVRRPCTTTTSEAEACGKPAEQGAACSAELDSGLQSRCPSTTCSRCIAEVGPEDLPGSGCRTNGIKNRGLQEGRDSSSFKSFTSPAYPFCSQSEEESSCGHPTKTSHLLKASILQSTLEAGPQKSSGFLSMNQDSVFQSTAFAQC
ncbi:hypothetical protein U0070_009278 [Myodes glareolus]|uniref:Uncharacterized protein n=1 Tax=Myodes glareolus TaxID=447135 RepID=A0AAW0IR43_MYOGA